MNPKSNPRLFLALCGGALLAAPSIHAADADGTWTKNATGTQNWSDIANWSGGTVADGIGFSAYLSDVINATRIITLDSARTIGNIYAQDTSNDYTISGANTLTLDVSSGQSVLGVTTAGRTLTIGTAVTVNDGISKTGAGAVSITGAVTLGAAQTWTNNSAGLLSKTNATLLDNNGHQLTFDGTGNFAIGSVGQLTAVLTGSGNLVKDGTGRLDLGGDNTGFTGTVTINGGVLQMSAQGSGLALGTGNLTLNGGVLSIYWGDTYTRTLGNGASQVQILGGESGFAGAGGTGPTINLGTTVKWGTVGEGATGFFNPGKFVLGDSGTTNAGSTTFSSGIDLNGATRTILVPKGLSSAGNTSTISGAITNSTGTGSLIKEGGGTLSLNNASSSWNGGTTVSDGVLILTNASVAWNGTTTVNGGRLDFAGSTLNSIGGGAGVRDVTVAAGAVVRFNALSNTLLKRIVETTAEIGVMSGGTANSFDFSSSTGANLPNAFLGNFAGNGAKAEMSGTITPGSDGYKFGALGSSGNLGIRGAVTGANTLTVGQTGGSGIRVTLAGAKDFTGQTVINASARLILGDNLALQNSALNVGAAGGNIAFNGGTAAATITGNTVASSPTFGGLIGSRNLSSVFTNAASNNESNLTANLITGFTLNVANGNTFTYSGAIGGFGTGTTNNAGGGTGGDSTLTKTGDGKQILGGVNTYTGATSVNGGTLEIAAGGSTAAGSAVSVSNSGSALVVNGTVNGTLTANVSTTISGTGTIVGNATISGTHNPGNSPGIQTFSGDLTYTGGSSVVNWELSGNTTTNAANPNAIYDQILVGGNLDFTGTTTINLAFNGAGSGVLWADSLWDTDQSWTLYDVTTATTNFSNLSLVSINWLDSGGNLFSTTGGSFALNQLGNDVMLNYTVIPEPSAVLLGALGMLVLLRRRR